MNTKNVPPFIMLIAGLAAAVAMFIKHYELHTLVSILFSVLIVFYIIGLLVQKMFDVFGMQIAKAQEEAAAEENERADEAEFEVSEE